MTISLSTPSSFFCPFHTLVHVLRLDLSFRLSSTFSHRILLSIWLGDGAGWWWWWCVSQLWMLYFPYYFIFIMSSIWHNAKYYVILCRVFFCPEPSPAQESCSALGTMAISHAIKWCSLLRLEYQEIEEILISWSQCSALSSSH